VGFFKGPDLGLAILAPGFENIFSCLGAGHRVNSVARGMNPTVFFGSHFFVIPPAFPELVPTNPIYGKMRLETIPFEKSEPRLKLVPPFDLGQWVKRFFLRGMWGESGVLLC